MISIKEKEYFSQLLKRSSSLGSSLGKVLDQKVSKYQKRIKQGQFNIRTQRMPQLMNNSSRILQKYHYNRSLLQSKLIHLKGTLPNDEKSIKTISDKQRISFVKQMKLEQQKLNRQKQQKSRLSLYKQMQQELTQKQMKEAEQRIKKQNKRRQIQDRLKGLMESKELREQESKERERQFRQKAREKLLGDRMKQRFADLQNATLQEKKRKLAKIRQMHKPISKQELQEHLQKIKEFKQAKMQQKQQQMISQIHFNKHFLHEFYKSKWYKGILQEDKNIEAQQQLEEKERLKELKDREKKYSLYIKNNFVPESDQKLIEDIAKRIQVPIKRKKAKEVRQMGIDNLKYVKEIILTKQQVQEKKQEQKTKDSQAIPKKSINYLEEIKNNRKSNSLNENFLQQNSKKSLSESQKALKMRTYAQKLQKKANLRQQLNKVKNGNAADEQLDDIYAKALQTKLKILKAN